MGGERGYMLITLMLMFTLIAIAALAILPAVKQQWQRDREDELCHRGTMYMRAIQHYYRKMGRYPNSIDDLESSNHVRFLRKRYKDPMSVDPQTHKEKDFKLLHMQDVMLNNGPALGGVPGAGGGQAAGAPGGSPSAFGGFGGQQPGGSGGFGGSFGGASQMGGQQGGAFGQSGFGQSGFGQSGGQGGQFGGGQAAAQNSGNTTGTDSSSSSSGGSGTDSSGTSNPSNQSNPGSPGGLNSGQGGATGGGAPGPNGQTFGAGAILGVASTDKKDKTIREFNKKTKYTDWYFVYDPTLDRGGLLVGPWQPLTISGGGIGQPIGASGAPGQGSQTGFGQSSGGFGQSSGGFGQSSGGFGQQNPPTQQPQNQQPQN